MMSTCATDGKSIWAYGRAQLQGSRPTWWFIGLGDYLITTVAIAACRMRTLRNLGYSSEHRCTVIKAQSPVERP